MLQTLWQWYYRRKHNKHPRIKTGSQQKKEEWEKKASGIAQKNLDFSSWPLGMPAGSPSSVTPGRGFVIKYFQSPFSSKYF